MTKGDILCWKVDGRRCALPVRDHCVHRERCTCALKHHGFVRERPENWKEFCAACYVWRDVIDPFFICQKCLRRLPDDLRRRILAEEDARSARREALEFLMAPDPNDIRMPPKARSRGEGCRHDRKYLREQKNIITGATNQVCDKCGRVRYASDKKREVMA